MENENLTPVPEQPQYQAPEQPQYQPPAPQYQAPEQPQYQAPEQPQYQPSAPQYQAPAQPQYQPSVPQYQAPAQTEYQPPAPQYQPPAQPQYTPPMPQYQAHAQTEYQPPMPQDPQYRQPYEQPIAQPQEPEMPKKQSKRWKILLPVAVVLALAILAGAYFLFLRKPSEKRIALENDVYLKTGDVFTLDYTAEAEAACEWTSSNEAVATVRDGALTAVGEGSCVISLKAGGETADCRVTVVPPPANGASIVGTWHFDGAFIDDTYYNKADCRLTVYADGRAAIVIDGKSTGLSWHSANSAGGVEYYAVTADDGTTCAFWYYAATGGDYAGKLVLYGDENNMFIFKK